MNPLFQGRLPCCALRNSNDAVRFRHSGRAATKSTSSERPASTWELSGSEYCLKLSRERLDAGTALEPYIGMRFVIERERFHFHSH